MPAKLKESGAIDRDGAGANPAAGSNFTLVEPVPRGAAWRWDYMRADWSFMGGRPRCPRCLKSDAVSRPAYYRRGYDFHCNRCKVCWKDTNRALCYVCDEPFEIPPRNADRHIHAACTLGGREPRNESFSTSYHWNRISSPFCPSCASRLGTDRNHSRRQLRRMVGLR